MERTEAAGLTEFLVAIRGFSDIIMRISSEDAMVKRLIACLVVCVSLVHIPLLSTKAYGQVVFRNNPKAEALVRDILNASYNLQFEAAHTLIDKLLQQYPNHPAGYVYRAQLYWWQALRDKENKDLEKKFDESTAIAIEKAREALKVNPNDKVVLTYLAGAYGNATRYDAMITRRYFSAMRNGRRGFKYIQEANRLDPNYYDTYIGMGSYNYFTGALPAVIKPFAFLFGARGDKKLGIDQLKLAAEKGEYGRTEAKVVLLSVYQQERDFAQFEQLIEELSHQYPHNYVFYSWAADHYVRQRQFREGDLFFSSLLGRLQKLNEKNRISESIAWANYEWAGLLAAAGQSDRAHATLSQIETSHIVNANLLARINLMRGNLLDVLNRREEALMAYQQVLKYPDVERSHWRARQYSKNRFTF